MEKISTYSQQIQFQQLLQDQEVNKILFSGRFGTGKTTFLRDFFEANSSFVPVYLFPVNYSVATNEDVFEYIKYDILIQFLSMGNIEEYLYDISDSIIIQVLLMNDPKYFIMKILKSYSKISNVTEKIQEFLNGTQILKEELIKYKESEQVDNFLAEFKDQRGSLFESNLITGIIQSIISRWKEADENKDKKFCLVIDDTERIDPEHIFRILNVFAAHNDIEDETKNKFGFDKIITVCDAQNLQSIFHARYGIDTDFYGYISKFHSRSIFHFDFQKEIITQIDTIFKNYKVENDPFISTYNFFYGDRLKYVLSELLKNRLITIRMIKKNINNNLDLSFIVEKRYLYNNIYYNTTAEYIIWLYKILIQLFDGQDNLYKVLEKMDKLCPISYAIEDTRRYQPSSVEILLSDIIYLLDRVVIEDAYRKMRKEPEKWNNSEKLFILPNNMEIRYEPNSRYLGERITMNGLKDIPIPLWKMLIIGFQRVELIIQNPVRIN